MICRLSSRQLLANTCHLSIGGMLVKYLSNIGWYVSFHSTDTWLLLSWYLLMHQYIGQLSVQCCSSIGWMLIEYQSSIGSMYHPSVDSYLADISTECREINRPIVSADTIYSKHDQLSLWKCSLLVFIWMAEKSLTAQCHSNGHTLGFHPQMKKSVLPKYYGVPWLTFVFSLGMKGFIMTPNGTIYQCLMAKKINFHGWKLPNHFASKCSDTRGEGGGVNSKKVCFGRKRKFFQESEDFAGVWETWKNFLGDKKFWNENFGKFEMFLGMSP